MILRSQTSTRGTIVGFDAQNLDAQHVLLNTFENIVNRRVNIPEDIQRFQNTLQYARSKVDYAIGEHMYMLKSDMNLRIGKVKNYNNKILTSKPGFKLGINLKINLGDEKDKPDVKSNAEQKQDIKSNTGSNKEHKPNIKLNKERKHDTDKITYEEEKVALVLGITSIFTAWWIFK